MPMISFVEVVWTAIIRKDRRQCGAISNRNIRLTNIAVNAQAMFYVWRNPIGVYVEQSNLKQTLVVVV
jgi:hypothetical protein